MASIPCSAASGGPTATIAPITIRITWPNPRARVSSQRLLITSPTRAITTTPIVWIAMVRAMSDKLQAQLMLTNRFLLQKRRATGLSEKGPRVGLDYSPDPVRCNIQDLCTTRFRDCDGSRLAGRPTWAHDPILIADEKSIWTGLKRGLARRCPNCGKGQLLRGYLTIRSPCEVCGNDNSVYP